MKSETININGRDFGPADTLAPQQIASRGGMEYVIIRGDRSGVFAGYMKERNGREVELVEARRLWYWDGAASISQIARDGVSKPNNCKFSAPVNLIVLDAIEIVPTTKVAQSCIEEVTAWTE